MKKKRFRICAIACALCLLPYLILAAAAHQGKTDSSGGHKDNKNKSGLGSYHYHCGGYPAHLHTGGYCPYTDVFPTYVQISTEKTTLRIGETAAISAAVSPSNACNTEVTWQCSAPDVIQLGDGTMEAVGYGTAVITATSFNEKVAQTTITVKEITAQQVSVTAAEQEAGSSAFVGDQRQLSAVITPENVDDPTISWASSDETVAAVDDQGVVKALKAGTTVITATASNGVVGAYPLQVQDRLVEAIAIDGDETVMLSLGETLACTATVTPENATYPDVAWSSSDETVAAISEQGVIQANGCGTATITARSSNGLEDQIVVTVEEIKANQLEIQGGDTVAVGETLTLQAVFDPVTTSNQAVEWSVGDVNIASVDQYGTLHGRQVGETTVTAVGKDVAAILPIRVLPVPVERIEISAGGETSLKKGETVQLSAALYPSNATYSDITWTISDSNIASIDSSGLVTALASGSVVVTATSGDGCKATLDLTVPLDDGVVAAILGIPAVVLVGGALAVSRRRRKKRSTEQNPTR